MDECLDSCQIIGMLVVGVCPCVQAEFDYLIQAASPVQLSKAVDASGIVFDYAMLLCLSSACFQSSRVCTH